jgi:hypothetical protein
MMADEHLHESELADLDRMGRALGELLSYEASPAEIESWTAGTRRRIQSAARRRRRVRVTGGLLVAASVTALALGLSLLRSEPDAADHDAAKTDLLANAQPRSNQPSDAEAANPEVPHPLAWDDRWEDALAGAYADAARLAWETPQVADTADVLRWRVEALEQELAGPSL